MPILKLWQNGRCREIPFTGTPRLASLLREYGYTAAHPCGGRGVCGKCSLKKQAPKWIASRWFRYGFLVFFLSMFGIMIFQTYLVAAGAENLKEAIKLLWLFRVPWGWTYTAGTVADWIAQFSFGFYSLMLTSTIIGFVVNILYKPRTWCSFCPMGTMTQMICKIKAK